MVVLQEQSGRDTKMGLERKGYDTILCQIGNKMGYIAGRPQAIERIKGQKQFRALMEEEKKIPLYKQAMQMQMGRVPKQKETTRLNCFVKVIDDKENKAPLTVWKIIH